MKQDSRLRHPYMTHQTLYSSNLPCPPWKILTHMRACMQLHDLQEQVAKLHRHNVSLQSQVSNMSATLTHLTNANEELNQRLEEASGGTSQLNDIIKGLEDRYASVVAAKGMAEDESARLRQLLDESLAGAEGVPASQHILRGYERRLAAAHQHLVRQVGL